MMNRFSEGTLKALIESLPGDICIVDSDRLIAVQNSSCRKKWGNVIGKSPEDVVSSLKTRQQFLNGYNKALLGESSINELEIEINGKSLRYMSILFPIAKEAKTLDVVWINMNSTSQEDIKSELEAANWDATHLLDSAAPSMLISKDFVVRRVNKTFCLEFEMEESKVLGHRCCDIWPSAQCKSPDCPMLRLSENSQPLEYEWMDEEGTGKKYLIYASPCRDQDGVMRGIVESYINTTEPRMALGSQNRQQSKRMAELEATIKELKEEVQIRENAQDHLRSSETRLLGLMDAICETIVIVDANLTILDINKAGANRLGTNPSELIGRGASVLPKRLADHRTKMIMRVFRTRKPVRWKDERDGIVFDSTGYPVFGDSGDVTQCIIVGHDITDLTEAQNTLRESEEKFRVITEQSMLGIMILQDGKIVFANSAAAAIGDFSVDEITSWQTEDISRFVHPDDRTYVMKQIQLTFENHDEVNSNYSFRVLSKKGEVRWIDAYSIAVTFGGRPSLLTSVVDVTGKALAESRLRELNEELVEERTSLEKSNIAMDALINRLRKSEDSIRSSIVDKIHRLVMPSLRRVEEYVPPGRRLTVKSIVSTLLEISRDFEPKQVVSEYKSLTRREREICHFVHSGYISKEIADILGISEATVFKFRSKIRKKLGITNSSTTLEALLQSEVEFRDETS